MARMRRPAMAVGIVAVSALLLSGCKLNGGGWINSNQGAKKATFGFTWQGDGSGIGTIDPTHAKGFWSDGPVKFRIAEGGLTEWEVLSGGCLRGEGTYESTSRNAPGGGDVSIYFCDEGEPGPSSGDYVEIDTDGAYSYSNSGTLGGGNLQVKDED